jgi:signal transduction histidine kinase
MNRTGGSWLASLRGRLVFIVLVVAVVPLGVLGLWLARSAERSGESLLRARLSSALRGAESQIGGRWISRRSALLDVAEWVGDSVTAIASARLPAPLESRLDGVSHIDFVRGSGNRVTLRPANGDGTEAGVLPVSFPVRERANGRDIGELRAEVAMTSLLPRNASALSAAGVVLAVLDSAEQPLVPVPFDAELLHNARFRWGGETWIAMRSRLVDPAVVLVASAPIAPFAAPFQEAGRRAQWILLMVALSGVALTLLATRGMTRSMEQLADAADAVASGDVDHLVPASGPQEVSRVARGFNTMIESLRRTLDEVAERRAQAAAGEFAASLAHEVRNPLTAIRLDLQLVEEQLPPDAPTRPFQERALAEIVRLDRTVGDALQKAAGGGLGMRTLNIRDPLVRAVHAASAAFTTRGLEIPVVRNAGDACVLRGEPGALEQLFLNLLLNAAQALDDGGTVSIECEREGHAIIVRIRDTGSGIAPDVLTRVYQPFFSTRVETGGTGLGLTIAQRIARAHGGELSLESIHNVGTTAIVRLPAVD